MKVIERQKSNARLDICSAIISDISISNSVSGSNMRVEFTIEGSPVGKARPRVT